MKKLLYITASPKPETESASKQAGRAFVGRFITANPEYTLEELDLYTADIPEPSHRYFKNWAELVSGPEYDALEEPDKQSVDRMDQLCTQFLQADDYIIASPMWNLSFPSRLKQYFDCILLNNRLYSFSENDFKGLLCDRPRKMVYIQSSGGIYPKIFYGKMNTGVRYCHDLFRHLGIREFYPIFIQGIDLQSVGKAKAMEAIAEDLDIAIEKMSPQKVPVSEKAG